MNADHTDGVIFFDANGGPERHQRFERKAFVFDVLVNGQLPADRFQATAGHNHGLIRSLALNRH